MEEDTHFDDDNKNDDDNDCHHHRHHHKKKTSSSGRKLHFKQKEESDDEKQEQASPTEEKSSPNNEFLTSLSFRAQYAAEMNEVKATLRRFLLESSTSSSYIDSNGQTQHLLDEDEEKLVQAKLHEYDNALTEKENKIGDIIRLVLYREKFLDKYKRSGIFESSGDLLDFFAEKHSKLIDVVHSLDANLK